MTIRPAQVSDAEAIARIWNREIREGVSTFNAQEKATSEIAEGFSDEYTAFFVALIGGQVVGFAMYSEFRGGVGYAQTREITIYLDADSRGKGIGRALLQQLEASARTERLHVLVAGIGSENTAGLAFHTAMGFNEVGRLPEVGRKFDRWMDLVLMQKIL